MKDREFLESRGWTENADRVGPWRWTKREWRPASYYTIKDAMSLELSMLRVPKVTSGH